jgi:Fe-S cluster assembly ATP-binding protein
MSLKVEELKVSAGDKEVVAGVSLSVKQGEVVALMGPNGSGKTSLAFALAGHPDYAITSGKVSIDGEDITAIPSDKRARKGLFLSFQHPPDIPGVTVSAFLRAALKELKGKNLSVLEFDKLLKEKMRMLGIEESFSSRGLNEGFSGGEKKRMEMLQLAVLEPAFAVLDETDSGLDSDALKLVSNSIKKTVKESGTGILLITHYLKFLQYIKPDRVMVIKGGRIVSEGSEELANSIEERGFDSVEAGISTKGAVQTSG